MADRQAGSQLVAALWFVAAGLAFSAVAIRYFSDRELRWPVVVGGIFALIMGLLARARNRATPPGV